MKKISVAVSEKNWYQKNQKEAIPHNLQQHDEKEFIVFSLLKKLSPKLSIEPEIVALQEPVSAIGLSIETSDKTAFRDIARLGRTFQQRKEEIPIPNRRKPWSFVAVSKDYDEVDHTFTYMMGDVVNSIDDVPKGYISFDIPAIKYAVFPVRPRFWFLWGYSIIKTKRHAYLEWLPQSDYLPARIIDDFELHDARSIRRKKPEIDLYVAVIKKPEVANHE